MIAGLLNEIVSLSRPVVSTDNYGAETTSYEFYKSVRAEVRWKSGQISNEAAELFAGEKMEVIVRDAHPIAAKWLVEYNGEKFGVTAVEHNRLKGLRRAFCDRLND